MKRVRRVVNEFAEVVLKDLKHLESLPEVLGVGVLEQVADRAILEGCAKLVLPL